MGPYERESYTLPKTGDPSLPRQGQETIEAPDCVDAARLAEHRIGTRAIRS